MPTPPPQKNPYMTYKSIRLDRDCSGFNLDTPKNPINSKAAENHSTILAGNFFRSIPEKNPPRQKNIMDMVKVKDSCDSVQSV